MKNNTNWNKQDILQVISAIFITIFFSMRKAPFPDVLIDLAKHLWAYAVYSIATVLIIIGLTKKLFKYYPTMAQIIKWSAYLAALCAISQFLHEGYKALTGQG
jgi:hypothetical protein